MGAGAAAAPATATWRPPPFGSPHLARSLAVGVSSTASSTPRHESRFSTLPIPRLRSPLVVLGRVQSGERIDDSRACRDWAGPNAVRAVAGKPKPRDTNGPDPESSCSCQPVTRFSPCYLYVGEKRSVARLYISDFRSISLSLLT